MTYWYVLHVLSMFVAFAFTTGVGILLTAVANSRDVQAIRTVTKVAMPLQIAGGIVLLAGVAFGALTAVAAGYSITARWLTIAYVLVALILASGVGIHQRWVRRVSVAAAASPDDRPSNELAAAIGDRFVRISGPITGLLWVMVIADMVVRR